MNSDEAFQEAWMRYWQERKHRSPVQSLRASMKEAFTEGYNAGLMRAVELLQSRQRG